MKNKIFYLFIIILCCSATGLYAQFPKLKGPYMGQVLPGNTAKIFAPGIISTGLYERDFTVSPKFDEIYYSVFLGDWNTIMVTKEENGVWTEPVVALFARDTNFFFAEPALSIDGNKIFYLSTKPRENEVAKGGWQNQNIWFTERKADGSWSESKPLPQNINEFDEFYPSITKDGTLYFCRTDAKTGTSQILRSKLVNNTYADPEILPSPINESGNYFNACIAPDDSYLIGCVARDTLNPNKTTYMLFFHNDDDTWSKGIDLIKELNLPSKNAISVSISPDGKNLFFASTVKTIRFKDLNPDWTLSKLNERRKIEGNGNSDIYWMSTDFIKNLKLKPVN